MEGSTTLSDAVDAKQARGTWDAAAARRDHGTGKGVAAVHPNPEALARAPELDAADVGPEIFLRVFGRHSRLDRVAPDLDVVLAVQTCV